MFWLAMQPNLVAVPFVKSFAETIIIATEWKRTKSHATRIWPAGGRLGPAVRRPLEHLRWCTSSRPSHGRTSSPQPAQTPFGQRHRSVVQPAVVAFRAVARAVLAAGCSSLIAEPLLQSIAKPSLEPSEPSLGPWWHVADGQHRIAVLTAPAEPPPGSVLPRKFVRAGRWQSAPMALTATVLKIRAVAVWRALGQVPRQQSHAWSSMLLPAGLRRGLRHAYQMLVSLHRSSSLARQAGAVREVQSGRPWSPSHRLQAHRRLYTWLSQRGIVHAEQRCSSRNKGDTWPSLRQCQHRRSATAQGALAGREPPARRQPSAPGRVQWALAA